MQSENLKKMLAGILDEAQKAPAGENMLGEMTNRLAEEYADSIVADMKAFSPKNFGPLSAYGAAAFIFQSLSKANANPTPENWQEVEGWKMVQRAMPAALIRAGVQPQQQ